MDYSVCFFIKGYCEKVKVKLSLFFSKCHCFELHVPVLPSLNAGNREFPVYRNGTVLS